MQTLQNKYHKFIKIIGDYEYWWNVPIKISTKLSYNKLDILIWNKKNKDLLSNRNIFPADLNITPKTNEKLQKYAPLLKNLQMMHND